MSVKWSKSKLVNKATAFVCAAAVIYALCSQTVIEPESPDTEDFVPHAVSVTAASAQDSSVSDSSSFEEIQDDSSEMFSDSDGDLPNEPESISGFPQPPESSAADTESFSDGGGSLYTEHAADISSAADDTYSVTEQYTDPTQDIAEPDNSSHIDSSEDSQNNADSAAISNQHFSDSNIAGDRTEDGGETDINYFDTDITDGIHLTSPQFEFRIIHHIPQLTVRRTEILVNGSQQPYAGSVMLDEGENRLRIAVTYVDSEGREISAYREYTVYYDSPVSSDSEIQEPEFVTDLHDHTRSDPHYEFMAAVEGADDYELRVYQGAGRLEGEDNRYSCELESGANTINVRGGYNFGGEYHEISESFVISLTAETTTETAPYLEYHNVPDKVNGSAYTLDILARDCMGERIYSDGLDVRLNGVTLAKKWGGSYETYLLNLTPGENLLEIRVTDSAGRYSDNSFVISCIQYADGEVIGQAKFGVDAKVLGLGEICPQTDIDIVQGETAEEMIIRALESQGFRADSTEGYLSRIYREGLTSGAAVPEELLAQLESDSSIKLNYSLEADSLGERDYSSASGWMISVNGRYINYGINSLTLKNGDEIKLRFTLALGKDIGDGESYGVIY